VAKKQLFLSTRAENFRMVKKYRTKHVIARSAAMRQSVSFHKKLTGYPGWDNLLIGTPEGTRLHFRQRRKLRFGSV
jgi:hypothetical protein